MLFGQWIWYNEHVQGKPRHNDYENKQIQLVVNHTGEEEDSIDLGNVFHNMKLKKRLFAWVLVLCLTVGVCAPLLL